MNNLYDSIKNNPSLCREEGRRRFFDKNSTAEERNFGLRLLFRAVELCDLQAMYIVGSLCINECIKIRKINSIEYGADLLCYAANKGHIASKIALDKYCEKQYDKNFNKKIIVGKQLVDFNGKTIKINRKGLFTPIDAKLEYKNGRNTLILNLNVFFLYTEDISIDIEMFKKAVVDGFKKWEGEYVVFGGQQLSVKINITTDEPTMDSVYVLPVTKNINDVLIALCDKFNIKKRKKNLYDLFTTGRSFAISGIGKWKSDSIKIACIQDKTFNFEDYNEIRNDAKHEFGHLLGLGDLYKSSTDNLSGVNKGTYTELDCYYIHDNVYNLVMCKSTGIISNNDIEMVVLAFSKNKPQNYQPQDIKVKISEALGKGN
ncbi:MAG: hypothetical protein U0M42_01445 [Acutalibacteraceae bacterium]|nr:hypothetical protein [Acutalibacteraceae bacterium]